MIDLYLLLFEAAFEGALIVVAGLLVATYVAFARMQREVRRARMFIMADRVKRFLGAFTLGFLVIAADVSLGLLGLPPPALASAAILFLFLGAVVYGSLQLFLIVRPRQPRSLSRRGAVKGGRGSDAPDASLAEESPEGGMHAAR